MRWIQIPLALVTISPLAIARAESPHASPERGQEAAKQNTDRLSEVLGYFSTTPIRVKARANRNDEDEDEHVDCCGAAG